jgi:hypothetical protein
MSPTPHPPISRKISFILPATIFQDASFFLKLQHAFNESEYVRVIQWVGEHGEST